MSASLSPESHVRMGHLPDQGLGRLFDLLISFNDELDAREREAPPPDQVSA